MTALVAGSECPACLVVHAGRIRARVEHKADKHLTAVWMWAYRRTKGRIVHHGTGERSS